LVVPAENEVEAEVILGVEVASAQPVPGFPHAQEVEPTLQVVAALRADEICECTGSVDLIGGLLVVDDAAERIAPSTDEIAVVVAPWNNKLVAFIAKVERVVAAGAVVLVLARGLVQVATGAVPSLAGLLFVPRAGRARAVVLQQSKVV